MWHRHQNGEIDNIAQFFPGCIGSIENYNSLRLRGYCSRVQTLTLFPVKGMPSSGPTCPQWLNHLAPEPPPINYIAYHLLSAPSGPFGVAPTNKEVITQHVNGIKTLGHFFRYGGLACATHAVERYNEYASSFGELCVDAVRYRAHGVHIYFCIHFAMVALLEDVFGRPSSRHRTSP